MKLTPREAQRMKTRALRRPLRESMDRFWRSLHVLIDDAIDSEVDSDLSLDHQTEKADSPSTTRKVRARLAKLRRGEISHTGTRT